MKKTVLDASAVIVFLEDRPGAAAVEKELVEAVAGKRELFMSVVNWGEVYYSVWKAHGEEAARQAVAEIAQFPVDLIDVDLEMTQSAAELRARHALPYADCFVAALAKLSRARVLTSDPHFHSVESQIEILFI